MATAANTVEESALNNLSGDALVEVLRHLTVPERLKLESTCKLWQGLMPYGDATNLNVFDFCWNEDVVMTDFVYSFSNITVREQTIKHYWLKRMLFHLLGRIGQNLRRLSFSNRRIRVIITPEVLDIIIEFCPYIDHLDIGYCFVLEDALDKVAGLKKLQSLIMPSCRILNWEFRCVQSLDRVNEIFIRLMSSLPLVFLNIANLGFMPLIKSGNRLSQLHLQEVNVDDETLASVCRSCPLLSHMYLSGCRNVHDFTPLALLRGLTCLWLNSTNVTTTHLERICRNCPKLQALRIDNCVLINEFTCLKLLRYLYYLWVGPSASFTDRSLTTIAGNRRLQNLNLMRCSSLSDAGVSYLAANCPGLRELNISHVSVNDNSISPLVHNCPQLEYLNLERTAISNHTVAAAGSYCRHLRTLVVRDCPNTDEQGFRTLLKWRGEQLNAGETFENLEIIVGGEGATVSESLVLQLINVGVTITRRPPLLALPGV